MSTDSWAYYNDFDPFICDWVKELMKGGLIMKGEVDCRPIEDVEPADLKGFVRHHFFCGIAGWDLALQLAKWPEHQPIATASLPCQPFSVAGQRKGEKDERHVWPAFRWIVSECRFPVIFGEQVPGAIQFGWLDGVFNDLEKEKYTCGAIVSNSCSVGSPQIRQRLWWVAISEHGSINGRLLHRPRESERENQKRSSGQFEGSGDPGGMADTENNGQKYPSIYKNQKCTKRQRGDAVEEVGFWSNSILIPCLDGKWRRVPGRRVGKPHGEGSQQGSKATTITRYGNTIKPTGGRADDQRENKPEGSDKRIHRQTSQTRQLETEPALFPLAYGIPNRVGMLRGAGNSIVPQVAAVFIRAVMDIMDDKNLDFSSRG